MEQSKLKELIRQAKFQPGLLGFFINHNFLIRTRINRAIKKNARELQGVLLDFGCGSKPYAKYFTHTEAYIGVDYKIEGRNDNDPYIDYFYDGRKIPFNDHHFDSLLCTEVLEHVFNIDELLGELSRVLKPGATALITTPFMWEEHEMPYDFARYTTPALKTLYARHGFEVVRHEKTGGYVVVIVQFMLNYVKNVLPENKKVRQILLLPFIPVLNTIGLVFGLILPRERTAYFNNVFVLRKQIR